MIALNSKPSRIFYGWYIVGACFLLNLYSGGAVILGFTAFFEPIVHEFDWSYTQVSLAASLREATVGVLAPLIGILVDRWGPRRLLFGGTVLLGLSLVLLSHIASLATFYGFFAIVALGMSGLSPTVFITATSNWFRKRAGLATGIMTCGLALGSLMVPIIVKLIDVYDWRSAIFILGVGTWGIGVPLSLLVRHKPEQYGYLPDGDRNTPVIPNGNSSSVQNAEVNINLKGALKSRAFWHIGLAMTLMFLAISTVIVHVMPYLSSVGIARSTSSMVATAIPLTSIVGRLSSGWLADRFNKKQIAVGFIIIVGSGLLFFSYVSDERMWLLIPFVILFGTGWGSDITIMAALLREYFGRSNLGTIFGSIMGLALLGAVIGPILAGWVFDNLGSYHAAWLLSAGLVFVAAVIMAATPHIVSNTRQDTNGKH
jgi:MFS transporter, OFA family, oxalate/formate antiporter